VVRRTTSLPVLTKTVYEGYEHIWARALPEAHHRALCGLFHLPKFLDAAKGRREHYYVTVEKARGVLNWGWEREPSEQEVIGVLALVLGRDRTFLSYVSEHGGASQALDPVRWRLVLESGAGTIVGQYLITHEITESAI